MASFNIGDRVRVTGTVEQADGTNIDPTVVKSWFRTPAGTITTYTYLTDAQLVKSAVGVYYMDVDLDTVGRWYYGFYSTGTGKASSSDGVLDVQQSRRNL